MCDLQVLGLLSGGQIHRRSGQEDSMDGMDGNATRAWAKQVAAMTGADELLQEAETEYGRQLQAVQVELDEAWDNLQATVHKYQAAAGAAAMMLGEVVAAVEDHHDGADSWTEPRTVWHREMVDLRDNLAETEQTVDERPQLDTDGTIVRQLLGEECAALPTEVAP